MCVYIYDVTLGCVRIYICMYVYTPRPRQVCRLLEHWGVCVLGCVCTFLMLLLHAQVIEMHKQDASGDAKLRTCVDVLKASVQAIEFGGGLCVKGLRLLQSLITFHGVQAKHWSAKRDCDKAVAKTLRTCIDHNDQAVQLQVLPVLAGISRCESCIIGHILLILMLPMPLVVVVLLMAQLVLQQVLQLLQLCAAASKQLQQQLLQLLQHLLQLQQVLQQLQLCAAASNSYMPA